MASRRTVLVLGLAATLVGSIQVATTLADAASSHLLSVIAALRLFFCGSLLVVGALVLVNVWRPHERPLTSHLGRLARGPGAGSMTA